MTDLEELLEQLASSARSSVAAAVATLMSAASMVQEHTEQIRQAMEVVMCCFRECILCVCVLIFTYLLLATCKW